MSKYDLIKDRLMTDYGLKNKGKWLEGGICPVCRSRKKTLFAPSDKPTFIKCNRINSCGYSASTFEIYEELFKEWSKDYKQTEEKPNNAADMYLLEGRGLDISAIKGSYTQESYFNKEANAGSATVRFALPNGGYWERIIDKPERFPRKANIKYGYSIAGQVWQHPRNDAFPKELWLTEGIFDACALAEHGLNTVSCLSCNNFPHVFLDELRQKADKARRTMPLLIWAFDSDEAGRRFTKSFAKKAKELGFKSVAALPADNLAKTDWNELHQKEALNAEDLAQYRYYGDLLLATSAKEKGALIYLKKLLSEFYFTFDKQTYWFEVDAKELAAAMKHEESAVNPDKLKNYVAGSAKTYCILNAVLRPLYFQRNEITDESWHFVELDTYRGKLYFTLTGDQLSSPAKLKPRLLSAGAEIIWRGNSAQLDAILDCELKNIKYVKTLDFVGYSKEHGVYIFDNIAVKDGKLVEKNDQDYFSLGKLDVKSLSHDPVITISDNADFSWFHKFYKVRGVSGLIVLAWWLGSYFAEQIRGISQSYPFFELVGEAGAGKSRLLEFFWKLSGRANYEGFDPTKSSNVGIFRSFVQVSNLPICLIEGDRNDENGNPVRGVGFHWDSVKDAYNGRAIRSIGVKNSANDTYSPPFRAALMISQNETVQAHEAVIQRIIHMHLTRDGQTLETKRLVDELDRLPMEVASGFIAHALKQEKAILATYTETLASFETQFYARVNHTRIALNHAQIASLLVCLKQHMLPMIDDPMLQKCFDMLYLMAQERQTRIQKEHPAVEGFWEVYEYLQSAGAYCNHFRVDNECVAINLNYFVKLAREHNQQLSDLNALKRLLKSSNRYKFIDSNKCVSSNLARGKTVKCWIFKKPQGVD